MKLLQRSENLRLIRLHEEIETKASDCGGFYRRFNQRRGAFQSSAMIELLCWKTDDAKYLEALHAFIDAALVIELEQPIKLKTAEMRRRYKILLSDAIIATVVLIHRVPLPKAPNTLKV